MILVFGATGTIGRHLVRQLPAGEVTAFVRDRAAGARLGCRFVVGDLDDPASVAAALAGVDRVFLNSGGAVPVPGEQPLVRQQRTVIDAASAAGVEHVVKLSVWHAGVGRRLAEGAHGVVERHLAASGLRWSVLRPNGFMQNFHTGGGTFTRDGDLLGAYGAARISYVDCVDVAAAAAVLLTGEARDGATFVLTGPRALTQAEIAARLSAVAGREIRYRDLPAPRFARELVALGVPEGFAADVAAMFAEISDGRLADVTPDLPELIGRSSRTFEEFLRDERDAVRRTWAA
ncbi:NAD(P)H-binding protein [Nocardia sp. NRRL S-836]|uniref:NmrA family NAD(P)-binding protein n=1 Tax=Nocardia sp. NRRL S-836 TaxID=1519492 RepID=UPI0006ADEC08|nr:NAD(P)H-binding protein [Nocardia sp. NRRL S-836]KOV89904.1 NmrA family protein [Nocardia sp. NRRL S-836]